MGSSHPPQHDVDGVVALLERSRPAAVDPILVFDADGTLWSGDVGFDLFTFAIRRRLFRSEAHEALLEEAVALGLKVSGDANAVADALLEAHEQGRYDDARAFGMMAWAFAGYTHAEVVAIAAEAMIQARVRDRVHRGVDHLLAWAARCGVEVVVCSASPIAAVEQAVAALGISATSVIAVEPAIEAERLIPRLGEKPMPYGEGKIRALDACRPGASLLGAFGDSAGDVYFLRRAHVPVAVAPNSQLLELAPTIPRLVMWQPS